jgi:VIT1/CCC1 family predicted Fe2+/Mn2+ transporter
MLVAGVFGAAGSVRSTDRLLDPMTNSLESFSKTDPFAAAIALQEQHARAYSELADRIRTESPEAASILLTMRQRQQSELRKLMCVYGFSSSKRASNLPPSPALAAVAEEKNKASAIESSQERELKRKIFVLQIVQPGLAGLMDGSVSTLAPVFAAAFATHNSHTAFLVGMAASLGAGISMGFAEALSDDGVLSGRGRPWMRGGVCGLMTTLGGIGHTLPFLLPDFMLALWLAVVVVAIELGAISWIRKRYMDTPLLQAVFQVVLGGILVFLTGILIGNL